MMDQSQLVPVIAPAPRGRGRPRRDDAGRRREAILDHAIRLFAEQGLEATSVSQVAVGAGVTEGLVRHYFGNRDGLLAEATEAVMVALRSHYREAAEATVESSGSALIDRLAQVDGRTFLPRPWLLGYLAKLFASNLSAANAAFSEYFGMTHVFVKRVAERSTPGSVVDPFWLTMQLVFMQLGPAFLRARIEALLDRDIYEPDVAERRQRQTAAIFKHGLFSQDAKEPS